MNAVVAVAERAAVAAARVPQPGPQPAVTVVELTDPTTSGETLEVASLERMEELWQAAKGIQRQIG